MNYLVEVTGWIHTFYDSHQPQNSHKQRQQHVFKVVRTWLKKLVVRAWRLNGMKIIQGTH